MDIGDTGAAITAQSTPTTQLFRITAKMLTADPCVVTREMLADAPAFEDALTRIFASHFAQALESAYLLGDGITRSRGILSYGSTVITQKTIRFFFILFTPLSLEILPESRHRNMFR